MHSSYKFLRVGSDVFGLKFNTIIASVLFAG
jgi:hypothetical protein